MRSSGDPAHLSSETGTLFVFFTGGIVFLTLILNGSTTQFVLHFLRMDRLSSAKRRILEYTKFEMQKMALEAFRDLGEDEELGPADWPTVKRYIKSLGNIEEEGVQSDTSESVGPHAQMDLKDIRVRLLNGSSPSNSGKKGDCKSSRNGEAFMPWWTEHGSKVHMGVGCDNCGMYPIVGDRYRCQDCIEVIGFDLCGDCYNTRSKRPGRFNQQHTPDHRFELVNQPVVL